MTDEQILSLVEEYFVELNPFCGFTTKEYAGKLDDFVKFARAIHENGYNKGYYEGYKSGSTGVFGEPLG
jgi:hypothetical protein